MGCGVKGSWSGAWGSGVRAEVLLQHTSPELLSTTFRVGAWGSGFRIRARGLRVQGLGFWANGSGFGFEG